MIKLFHPNDLGYDLIRIGDNSDGGYFSTNCLSDIKNCFSVGVDNKTSFENDLFKKENSFSSRLFSRCLTSICLIKKIKSFNSDNQILIWIENKENYK